MIYSLQRRRWGIVTTKKPGKTQLPPLEVDDELVKGIEDVQHELRFKDRAKALRAIIVAGIAKLMEEAPKP